MPRTREQNTFVPQREINPQGETWGADQGLLSGQVTQVSTNRGKWLRVEVYMDAFNRAYYEKPRWDETPQEKSGRVATVAEWYAREWERGWGRDTEVEWDKRVQEYNMWMNKEMEEEENSRKQTWENAQVYREKAGC